MKKAEKQQYAKPAIQWRLLAEEDAIMLSYGKDPNQGSWELLMHGVAQEEQTL